MGSSSESRLHDVRRIVSDLDRLDRWVDGRKPACAHSDGRGGDGVRRADERGGYDAGCQAGGRTLTLTL